MLFGLSHFFIFQLNDLSSLRWHGLDTVTWSWSPYKRGSTKLFRDGFCDLFHIWLIFIPLKACVRYFLSNVYFFIKWEVFKNYEICFLFHLKSSLRSRDIQFFVNFFLPFHTFQIQNGKWKWNNLSCHKLACIYFQMYLLEYLKNCFILHHQTWSDNT